MLVQISRNTRPLRLPRRSWRFDMCVRVAELWSGSAGQACTGKDTTRRDRRVRHRGERHKTARTYVCVYVRMRVFFSVLTFEAPVCCAARPDTSSALATMSPKLVKNSGLKASSATSSQSSPHAFSFHCCTSHSDNRFLRATRAFALYLFAINLESASLQCPGRTWHSSGPH